MTNEIISAAKEALKGKWWEIMGTYLAYMGIIMVAAFFSGIPLIGWIFYLGVALFLSVGMVYYSYTKFHNNGKINDLFIGFKNVDLVVSMLKLYGILFLIVFAAGIVMGILAFVPVIGGIVAVVAYIYLMIYLLYYAMAPYIIVENPKMKIKEVLKNSKQITTGHRWTYIWLQIKIYLIPLLILFGGLILGTVISFSNMGALANTMGGLDFATLITSFGLGAVIFIVCYLVSLVWMLILVPLATLAPVAHYEKVKELSNVSFTANATNTTDNILEDSNPNA